MKKKKKLSFNDNNECTHTEKAGNFIVLIYPLQAKECDMNPIDQRNKKQSERAAALPSPINQQHSEKKKKKDSNSLGMIKEKEQQEKLNAREEEGEEEEEDEEETLEVGGPGGPQTETRENKRGKYRQYEESQVIIEKIRSYRTQRYPDSEIMKLLDEG